MTVKELFETGTKEQIARYLCIVANEDCENCVAKNYCKPHHTGFIDLLDKKIEDSIDNWDGYCSIPEYIGKE